MRNAKYAATRMSVSIAVAVLVVMATVAPVSVSTMSPAVRLSADSTALILGGTTVPTPDNVYIETVRNHFIAPTHPGDINYVAVTTPEEFWPITGLERLVWLALGPQSVWGPGGPGWPDEPWWKLSGLFDLTIDQSIQAGVADLEKSMAEHGNDHLVIYGYSQGAIIANREKQKLAEQYPAGTQAPDINFVLSGDANVPNGGLHARFPGLYIPILNWSFNGPEPTNTQFHTDVITRQYDGIADFPLYPLNLIADLNAVLGAVYVHPYDLNVSLPAQPTKSPAYQGTHGDTSYYFFPTEDLPLFAPLRSLGVPEPLIDVVEPFFKVIVDLGYDRSIKPWKPTPVRLIPPLHPVKVAADLVTAIGEGITNAAALFGAPAPLGIPTPAVTADQDAGKEQNFSGPRTLLQPVSHDVGDGVSRVLTAVGSQLPEPFAVSQDNLQASQRKVSREPVATNDRINETNGAVKSVIGNGRTIVRSARGDNGSQTAVASPAHKTPVQDAVKQARSDTKGPSATFPTASSTRWTEPKTTIATATAVRAQRHKPAELQQPRGRTVQCCNLLTATDIRVYPRARARSASRPLSAPLPVMRQRRRRFLTALASLQRHARGKAHNERPSRSRARTHHTRPGRQQSPNPGSRLVSPLCLAACPRVPYIASAIAMWPSKPSDSAIAR